jgi:hypothetical protein
MPGPRPVHLLGAILVALAVLGRAEAAPEPLRPWEQARETLPASAIDLAVEARLAAKGIEPAHLCSDEVFCRRVYLDVIGTLPGSAEVRAFLADRGPGKRAALIERLFRRPEFADFWSLKWCDLLRVKSEFPINLWPNAVQAYHRWVRDTVRQNWTYDRFVRALLTTSGSNFRMPAVNFYRAVQSRKPEALAEAVALTFMGTRLEKWSAERKAQFAGFFSRVAYKPTSEWKEEVVLLDPTAITPLQVVYPDGTAGEVGAGEDPREAFAGWLIRAENPWFARSIANRVWSWLLGRGLSHETDDLRPDNPPVHPEVLTLLEKELVAAGWDLRAVFRLILNSRVYQQSSLPRSENPEAASLFAHYQVRRLDAEVLADAFSSLTGNGEKYTSVIPEPFTIIPEQQRSIALADGSISSPFLELFGRPARDTGLESERGNGPSEAQLLHLLNSTHVHRKLTQSQRLMKLLQKERQRPIEMVRLLYLEVLSREPTSGELEAVRSYVQSAQLKPREIASDLVWALVNTKEFLYRH